MSKSEIQISVEDFDQKKRKTLEFIDQVLRAKEEFDADFPVAKGGADGASGILDSDKLRALRARLADARLKILVAGQFKTGKSSLLNAILGRQLLPEEVTPCTAVITEIEYGETPAAALSFKKNIDPERLSSGLNADVARHIAENAPNPPDYNLNLDDAARLQEYLTIPLGVEQAEGVRESPYAKCVLRWPLELCRGGAVLIDSPGLNEHEARDATTMGYLREADAVLHVMSATQPFGLPDKNFIRDVRGVGQDATPIIFAFNRFDQLRKEENREKLKKYVRGIEDLRRPYGDEGIFFTSATGAFDAREAGDSEGLEKSGLGALERKIARIFAEDRLKIKLGGAIDAVRALAVFADRSLGEARELIELDAGTLAKKEEETRADFERLNNLLAKIKAKINGAVDRYGKDLEFLLRDALSDFCDDKLPEIIAAADLPEIHIYDMRQTSSACVAILNGLVSEALIENIKEVLYTKGQELEREARRSIEEDVAANLEEFSELMDRLRRALNPRPFAMKSQASVNLGDFQDDLVAGGLLVGLGVGAGAVAAFVLARFLPAIAGPVGWAIALGSLAFSLFGISTTDNREQLRKKYLEDAAKLIWKEGNLKAPEIALGAANEFRKEIAVVGAKLEEMIEEARLPLRLAREAALGDRKEIERRKAALAEYEGRFAALSDEGRELLDSLKIGAEIR